MNCIDCQLAPIRINRSDRNLGKNGKVTDIEISIPLSVSPGLRRQEGHEGEVAQSRRVK